MSDYVEPNTPLEIRGNPFTVIGLSFAALGLLALLAPVFATTTTVVFLAATMLIWGALGVAFVLKSEAFPNRTPAVVGFGLIAAIGSAFLFFPTFGAEVLTIFLVAGLLLEGVVSILYAISMSSHRTGWVWMALSGVAALVVGVLVIIGWPETASWLIGLGLGFNFLTSGLAIFFLARSAQADA